MKYNYDVRWYIDDFEITEAAHTDVTGINLAYATMLRQHHWENLFKPNMLVRVLTNFIEYFNAVLFLCKNKIY